MAKAVGSLVFSMKVDDSKFTPTLNSMKQQVRNFNQTMKANVSAAKEAGDTLGAYEAKVEGLRTVVEKQKNVQESLSRSMKATGDRTKDNALQWDKAKSELDKATATYKNYQNQLDSATTKYERLKTGVSSLNRVIEVERKYTNELSALYKAQGNNIDSVRVKTENLEQENKRLVALRRKETEILGQIATKNGFASKAYIEQATRVEKLTHTITNNNDAISKNKKYLESNADVLSKLKKEYTSAADADKSLIERFKAEKNEVKANITQMNAYKRQLSQLATQYKLQVEDLNKMQSSSKYTTAEIEKQKKTVNETATSYARMRNNLRDTQKQVDKANPFGINKYASAANSAYRSSVKMQEGFSSAFTKIKEKAVSASLGIISIGAAAVKGASAATELQNTYVKTLNLATTGGEKAAEAQKNVNQMQKDGAKYSVAYGKSQKAIAEGYQELIKRGYTSAEALGAMKSELQASVASGDDFNNVLSVTSQVIDAYGLRTNNAAKMTKNTKMAVNQLAYAADMTATDFQSLGKSMEYVGDSAHNAGFKLSEASSAVGILSNHGLEADKAGTGLRKVINSITGALSNQEAAQKGQTVTIESLNSKIAEHQQKIADYAAQVKAGTKTQKAATNATKSQQEAISKLQGQIQAAKSGGTSDMLSSLGISRDKLVDSKGNLRDLSTIMSEINEKTKNMGTAKKNSVFNSLFGTTGQQAGIILAQNNKELTELNEKVKNAADGQGYVEKLAKKNMATVKQQVSQFKEAGNAALIMIGKQMLPVISEAAVEMTKAFNSKDGQEGLKKIASGIAWVADKLVKIVEFIGAHTTTVKVFGAAFAAIWATKKIGDTLNLIKEINDALKITQTLNSLTSGGLFGGSANKTLASTVEKTTIANASEGVASNAAKTAIAGGATTAASTAGSTAASAASTVGTGALASLTGVLSKALPTIGVATGLAQSGYSFYNATKTKDQTKQRTDIGGGIGGLVGTGTGALIGSIIAPGIGTAIGASLGGTAGVAIGKKFGKAYQEGFKESHPKSISAWLGDDWDASIKKGSSKAMKSFSKSYNDQINKLNKSVGLKLTLDTKNTETNKKKVENIYKDLQKIIDKFYDNQNKSSKKNLDVLVKNGDITKKEEESLLKTSTKTNESRRKSQEKLVNDMKKISSKYYDDAKKIDEGGTKALQNIEKKYGKNSKQYKTEQSKELLSIQKKYSKDITADEVKLNDKVSTAARTAAGKQIDILADLSNKKKKISVKQLWQDGIYAEKNYNVIVKNAQKTRDKVVDSANSKYKKSIEAADKEYYQNRDISKKEYDYITNKAKRTRDDTIDAAEKMRKGKVKSAAQEYSDITKKIEEQRKKVTDTSLLQMSGVISNAKKQKEDSVKLGNEQKSALVQAMEDQRKGTTDSSKKQKDDVTSNSKKQKDDTSSNAQKQKDTVIGHANTQKDTSIDHAQKQKDKTTSLANDQKNAIGDAATGQSRLVVEHATTQANSSLSANSQQAKGTNNIWKGLGDFFNNLVKGFGIKAVDVSTKNFGYSSVAMGAYATGSRGVPGGKALVGEAGIEARYSPYSGKVDFLGTNGAQVVDLNPGDRILNAKDTAKLFNGGLGKTLPGYAKGTSTIESFLSSIEKGASDIWDDVSDATSEAIEKITNPVKTLTDLASSTFDVNKLEVGDLGHESSSEMVKSSIENGFAKAISKIKSGFESSSSSGDGGSSKSAPSGSGVTRWTSQVKEALKANGLSTSTDMVNKVLRQIQTESGGNEKAVQGNIGDINNKTGDLAKGLMQTISSTFNAYAFSGHKDIFNGYDNLLAALNYAKHTYGNNLSYLGEGHGYANGGIATEPSIFGEAGPEMAVPLDKLKRSRAVQLTKELNQHFADDMKNSDSSSSSSELAETVSNLADKVNDISSSNNNDQLSKQLEQSNNLLTAMGQILQNILVESQNSNKPLSTNSMNSLSKAVINQAVRSVN